jgi:hypothetical protein
MKKCELGEWQVSKIILFFSLYSGIVFSMETSVVNVARHPALRPKETPLPLFLSKTLSERGKLWDEIVPGDIIITPDETGMIMSDHGRVRHFHFNTGKSDVIIAHHCIKNIPLIAVAQKQDKSLLVVSACNYHSEQDNKYVAEYAVYTDEFCRFGPQMDSPIQAISLNASGDLLVIADLVFVTLIDLNKKGRNQALFTRKIFDGSHRIVDIAMNEKGDGIVIAGSHGDVQQMLYGQSHLKPLANVKQVNTTDKIKKIYYPSAEEILYLTDQGKAKIVKTSELNEKDLNQQIDTIHFTELPEYNKVTADLGDQITVAYWTDSIKISQEVRQKTNISHREGSESKFIEIPAVKIYRKDGEGRMSEFTLELSDVEKLYNYRTIFGTLDEGIGHLLHVALRGNTVIALATDGRIRVWSLPEKNKSNIKPEVIEPEMRATEDRAQIKGRSHSANTNKNPLTGSNGEQSKDSPRRGRPSSKSVTQSSPDVLVAVDKQKKSSPRIMQILKGSRDSSPSPQTHHSESTDQAQEKAVTYNDERQYI